MIENIKNTITSGKMEVTKESIQEYLNEVKDAVRKGRYRIARNENRRDNQLLFETYVLDENKAKEIILSLQIEDFSEILQNEHPGFEYESLYVFGKDVELLKRFESGIKTVTLYIKFNKLENCFVIVVSFHESTYPIKYFFK